MPPSKVAGHATRATQRPLSMILPLQEAADLAHCTTTDLLHAGALGEIQLLVRRPDKATVQLHNPRREKLGAPALMRIPSLLQLRVDHCLSLQLKADVESFEFPLGYSYSPDTGLRTLHPSTSEEMDGGRHQDGLPRFSLLAWCSWHASLDGAPLRFGAGQVLITQTELLKFTRRFEGDVAPAPGPDPAPRLDDDLAVRLKSDGAVEDVEIKTASPHQQASVTEPDARVSPDLPSTDLGAPTEDASVAAVTQTAQFPPQTAPIATEPGQRTHSAKPRWKNASPEVFAQLEEDRRVLTDVEFDTKWQMKKESARQLLYTRRKNGLPAGIQGPTDASHRVNAFSTMAQQLDGSGAGQNHGRPGADGRGKRRAK